MLGALVSIFLVHGPLFPYLVVWAGALAVPAWVAVWLVLEPWATRQVGHFVRRHWARFAPAASTYGTRLVVPLASVATAAAVTWALASSPVPMAENSTVAHEVWDTVAPVVLAPGVRTVYLKVYPDDMPDTAAIADQVVRHGRQVELDRAALYYLDPSFAPRSASQLTIIVCCGRGDPGDPPAGMTLRGIVKGQEIYTSRRL